MSLGGGEPLRSAESRSEARLERSCSALWILWHDSATHAHWPCALAIFESTSLRKIDQASMSYGGLTKRPTPLPHADDALSAALMHELLTNVPSAPAGVVSFFRNFGERYFQAKKSTTTRMTSLRMRSIVYSVSERISAGGS